MTAEILKDYLPIILFLIIALGLSCAFILINFILSPKNPEEYSDSLTAVMVPDGHDADSLRKIILDHYNMSLGTGLAKVAGKIFRIGHLGDFNELMLAGTLAGVEMGLMKSKIPYKKGGILKALDYLC